MTIASIFILVTVFVATAGWLGRRLFNQKEDSDSKNKIGLRWSYNARPGEEKSYLIVVKIDNDPELGQIFHVTLRGLKMKNPRSPNGVSEDINHLPFLKEAIEKSGLKLLDGRVDLPDFQEGYRIWREAFDAERAGAYSITVAEAIEAMEQVLQR